MHVRRLLMARSLLDILFPRECRACGRRTAGWAPYCSPRCAADWHTHGD